MRYLLIFLAACASSAPPRDEPRPKREPERSCGVSECRADQFCYRSGDRPGSITNPRCELLPAACTEEPTCACLAEQAVIAVCKEHDGNWLEAEYYRDVLPR